MDYGKYADLYERAASLIERHGHARGAEQRLDGSLCVNGALIEASGGRAGSGAPVSKVVENATRLLAEHLGNHYIREYNRLGYGGYVDNYNVVAGWNDKWADRLAATSLLRSFATEVRRWNASGKTPVKSFEQYLIVA